MDKAQKRAAKAAKRAARAAARDQALSDIPILWVDPTGVERYHRGFHCRECKSFNEQDMGAEAIEEYRRIREDHEWPEPRPTITCQCGAEVEMNSAGLDAEYRAPSTGQVFERVRDLPPGAVWAQRPRDLGERQLCNWISNKDEAGKPFPEPKKGEGGKQIRFMDRPGRDGRVLICRMPDGHDWVIDSRANNCTLPLDDKHWCWVREGRPEDGTLNVSKSGRTCSAGAGSIATPGYHGFLRHGRLVRC